MTTRRNSISSEKDIFTLTAISEDAVIKNEAKEDITEGHEETAEKSREVCSKLNSIIF